MCATDMPRNVTRLRPRTPTKCRAAVSTTLAAINVNNVAPAIDNTNGVGLRSTIRLCAKSATAMDTRRSATTTKRWRRRTRVSTSMASMLAVVFARIASTTRPASIVTSARTDTFARSACHSMPSMFANNVAAIQSSPPEIVSTARVCANVVKTIWHRNATNAGRRLSGFGSKTSFIDITMFAQQWILQLPRV